MRLHWTAPALRDLEEILLFVGEGNPNAALALVDGIEEKTATLAILPNAGRLGKIQGTRELPITGTPYIVAYRIKGRPQGIEILAVRHGARRWPDEL
jgi:addiction module RelE/StbE family toxin